ncbi:MAG: tetratricopeptide repeat protein, partial [Myxococcales bacterium]|nr:tetratricopeptide repeat protein [Myxococcales bacterium]
PYQDASDSLVEARRAGDPALEWAARLDDLRPPLIGELGSLAEAHPDNPDAILALAHLSLDQAYADYIQDWEAFDNGTGPPPDEQGLRFTTTVALLTQFLEGFPEDPRCAVALAWKGNLLLTNDRVEEATEAFQRLTTDFPDSQFAAYAWLRLGELAFDDADYALAASRYQQVLTFNDYDEREIATYKLAWSRYLLDDMEGALTGFVSLFETAETALREEAIMYAAIILTDGDWDLDGADDPDSGLPRIRTHLTQRSGWQGEVLERIRAVSMELGQVDLSQDVQEYLESLPE